MTMLQTTLSSELTATGLYANEADAIDAWASAWHIYFLDASASGAIAPAALAPALLAMKAGLVGLNTGGAVSLQAGIIAFWGAIIPASAWAGAVAIAPPVALLTIAPQLTVTFVNNVSGGLSKSDAMDAIAATLHTINIAGGTVSIPPAAPIFIL